MSDHVQQKDPAIYDTYRQPAAHAPCSVTPSSIGSSEPTSATRPSGLRIPTITDACPSPIADASPFVKRKAKADKYKPKGSSDPTSQHKPKGSPDPTSQHKPKGPSGSTCRPSDTLLDLTGRDNTAPSERMGPSGPKKPRPAGGLPTSSAGNVGLRESDASTGALLNIGKTQTLLHAETVPEPSKQRSRDHMVLPNENADATRRKDEPYGSHQDLTTVLDSFTLQPRLHTPSWSICIPGPNKTGWEPLEDCQDHRRDERPHLRIEDAVPCFKTICKVKGGRRPQCAAAIGRLSISSFGKMYAILWASRHHLKPKNNPLDACEDRRTNEVVLDFINSVVRSRSSELPEIVNRYFDAIRDGFTEDPFMPYDFQTAVMRWQEGCPTAAAFLKAHPSGSVYFQPVFLNRCRRDIREAYLRVAESGFLEAIEWTRMRNYQVLMQFQPPWTPLRELSKTTKDCVVKVHGNQDNIVQEELVVFTDSSGLQFYDDPRLNVRVIRLCDVPTEAFAQAKKYFMGHLVQRVYWFCGASGFNDSPEDCGRLIRKVSDHFYRRFPHVRLYTVPVPDRWRTHARRANDSSESNIYEQDCRELGEPSGSKPPNEEATQKLEEPSGSPKIDESVDTYEPYGSPPLNIDEDADLVEPSGSNQPDKAAYVQHCKLPTSEPADVELAMKLLEKYRCKFDLSTPERAASYDQPVAKTNELTDHFEVDFAQHFLESLGLLERSVSSDTAKKPDLDNTRSLTERRQLSDFLSQPSTSNQESNQVSSDTIEQVTANVTEYQSIAASTIADEDGSLSESDEEYQRTGNEEEQSHEDELF